jgi:hypothetical protein
MKIKSLITTALLALAIGAKAQPTNAPSFFDSLTGYFTSHNLELTNTFGAHKGEAWTSFDSVQGNTSQQAKLLDAIGFQYSVYDHLSLENVVRMSGIAGTVATEQVGVGLNFVIIDTKITFYADGGYDIEKSRLTTHPKFKDDLFGELGVRGRKALTANTFAGIGMGIRVPDATQVYQVMAGFTF